MWVSHCLSKVFLEEEQFLLLILFSHHSLSLLEHINMVMCVLSDFWLLRLMTQHLFIFSFRTERHFHYCIAISCQRWQKARANISCVLPPLFFFFCFLVGGFVKMKTETTSDHAQQWSAPLTKLHPVSDTHSSSFHWSQCHEITLCHMHALHINQYTKFSHVTTKSVASLKPTVKIR